MSEDQGGPPEEIPLAAPGVEIPPEPEPVLLPFAAHVIDADGLIVNQVMVTSLDAIPGLVDASMGGRIGDSVIDGVLVPLPGPVVDPVTALGDARAALILSIDADADAIYSAVLGNRATEYAQAEAEATAFKSGDYNGAAPDTVQSWATVKGETAQWSADDILATAAAWRGAQSAIRLHRLTGKEAARDAEDAGALATVAGQWRGFVAYVKAQLGVA